MFDMASKLLGIKVTVFKMCIAKGQIRQLVLSLKLTYMERIVIFSMYLYDLIITLKLPLFCSVEPKRNFITPNTALNCTHWRI